MMLSNNLAFIGNLGTGELIVIMLVILLLFGAKRIPDLARGLGKGIREFKDATKEIQHDIERSVNDDRPNQNRYNNNNNGYNNNGYNNGNGYNNANGYDNNNYNNGSNGGYNNAPTTNPNPANTTPNNNL